MKRLGFMLGRPLAPLYSLAMLARAHGYRRGFFATHSLPVPVISVGNLLMGGTGKTPLVQYLARLLLKRGKKPAIISRGYGGKAKGPVNVVSDGDTLFLNAAQAGDEPRFLAESLPGVPVLTGIARHLPASEAVAMGADVLLLDDAFQHLAVQRDVNLVLFNADRLAGNSRVFPGGELREPVSALKRATAFVLTGVSANNRQRAELFAELLNRRFPDRPVYLAGYAADSALMLNQDGTCTTVPLDLLRRGQSDCLFAFCGIAGPDSFFHTLTDLSLTPTATFALQDHHTYNLKQMQFLCTRAQNSGAKALITTEKDLVKIGDLASHLLLPVYALRMRVEMDEEFATSLFQEINT
ncbi:MAG: tetraacyldisaccharide 4'-kinase [Desulfobulbaceae bacterium]|nr:tetraacyldisaccharide 4'-kinase [Desulfobulbaceae bacterium]